jgi:D-alanine-D-alanine ligase
MSNVVVLSGGVSNEREVSLRSGKAVAEALRAKGHTVNMLDPKDGLDDIGRPDAVFPALYGKGGEDGTIQAALEARGLVYVGSGVAASALCWDKWLYRQVLQAAGLPVAEGEVVTLGTIWQSRLSKQPFVLKPIQGGSTLDAHIVRDPAKADKAKLERSLAQYGRMLLEELIVGTELTAGVLGGKPLPVVEIVPPPDSDFDYDNKYNGQTQELCPPKSVSEAVQKRAQDLALRAHQLAGCRDLSRTDIMVNGSGELFILETNTLPGMTSQSLFPKEAATAGITFPDLCDQLVQMTLARA